LRVCGDKTNGLQRALLIERYGRVTVVFRMSGAGISQKKSRPTALVALLQYETNARVRDEYASVAPKQHGESARLPSAKLEPVSDATFKLPWQRDGLRAETMTMADCLLSSAAFDLSAASRKNSKVPKIKFDFHSRQSGAVTQSARLFARNALDISSCNTVTRTVVARLDVKGDRRDSAFAVISRKLSQITKRAIRRKAELSSANC
jgi:hypothetical protein